MSAFDEALARITPIDVPQIYADGVAFWMDVLAQHIALVEAIPLADDVEAAPVFRA